MLYSGSGVVFLLSLVSLPLPSLFVSVTSWDLIKKMGLRKLRILKSMVTSLYESKK